MSTEILGWGVAGGFGFATRSLGGQLARRGVDVHAVVPQPRNTVEREIVLDGIQVHAYPRHDVRRGIDLLRECDADIYHSQEPSLGTALARIAHPDAVHIVTSRDPRLPRDWLQELRHPTYSRAQVLKTAFYYENPVARAAVRKADGVFVPARFLAPVVKKKYRLERTPGFLPTPVRVPETVRKARIPTVCFVGRLDRRKKPETFFDLAKSFPDVRFLAAGAAQDAVYRKELEARYSGIPNLEMRGFVDQFGGDELSRILAESWILINSSPREGLPNSFIEACGHRCAILSAVDPDDFASRFGVHVRDGDFAGSLARLLEGDAWRERGESGFAYVLATNELTSATERHLDTYRELLRIRA